jgi:hypothetical protein
MFKTILFGLAIFAISRFSTVTTQANPGIAVKINKSLNKNALGLGIITLGGSIVAEGGSSNNIYNNGIAASNNIGISGSSREREHLSKQTRESRPAVTGEASGNGGNLVSTQLGSLNLRTGR